MKSETHLLCACGR